jgi:hypothetical protein
VCSFRHCLISLAASLWISTFMPGTPGRRCLFLLDLNFFMTFLLVAFGAA